MTVGLDLLIIAVASIVIFYLSDRFAKASSCIGDYMHIPKSVKGATIDAIASSLPELFIALFSVLLFKQFDVGIGTIAGSAMYNLLIIPALSVFVAPKALTVSRDVIARDGLFYNLSVVLLLGALWYSKSWNYIIPLIFLGVYIMYVFQFIKKTKHHRKTAVKKTHHDFHFLWEVIVALLCAGIIGIASYFMVDHAIMLSESLGIHPVIVAFTIVAAATSIPDTIVSVHNAKKGSGDDAVANAFGSNVFDILVGLGLPVLVYILYVGEPVAILFDNFEIVFGLIISTIMVLFFIAEDHEFNKKNAWWMIGMYLVFIGYVILLSFT